jgi:hypothetical protein
MIPESVIGPALAVSSVAASVWLPSHLVGQDNKGAAMTCAVILWPPTLVLLAVLLKTRGIAF